MLPTDPPGPLPAQSSSRIIVALAALVFIPLLVWEVPREKQRWKVATAVQERLDGDGDQALEILDELLRDDPGNVPVLLLRAQWQLDDGQGDRSLADVQQAIKTQQILAESSTDLDLLVLRSQLLQAMGDHPAALADVDAIVRTLGVANPLLRAQFLNMAAYARAIGNLELNAGLDQIDEALKHLPDEAALLDTRGFLLYRLGRHDEALQDIELAASQMLKELAVWEKKSRQSYSRGGGDAEVATKRLYRNTAVMLYHRGLVYAALGKQTEADKDFAQVREWGFEPAEQLY